MHLLLDQIFVFCLSVTLHGHQSPILGADVSPDGRFVLTASSDGTVRLWATTTGACHRLYRIYKRSDDHMSWIKAVKFTPAGDSFVCAGLDGRCVHLGMRALPYLLSGLTRNVSA